MVGTNQLFAIDTTFILEKTAKTFHGAPLLVVDGKDHTFSYGFVRDLLRLRGSLAIRRGILVIGREGHGVASDSDVRAVVVFAQSMGLPVVHKPECLFRRNRPPNPLQIGHLVRGKTATPLRVA